MATLGIVELFIFLLHKYYEDLNVPREQIFADVHFTLFYTAIFNAFQSVGVAFVASRVSRRLWVQTEQLELDHYVEIREAFEKLQASLYPNEVEAEAGGDSDNPEQISAYQSFRQSLRQLAVSIFLPRLQRRYLELLVQVRFHQLRVHFLEGNQLPLTLRVSDYLKRSEASVLKKLVHVSTFAWLFLTGGLTLIYYAMGLVAYKTGDDTLVGTTLTWIFFSSMVLFIFISFLVYDKTKRIFREIM